MATVQAKVEAPNIWGKESNSTPNCRRVTANAKATDLPRVAKIEKSPTVVHHVGEGETWIGGSDRCRQHQQLSRNIYPNIPFSPYSSPRAVRRRAPLKESRRVSIDKSGTFLQLNQYMLMDSIGQGSYGLVKLAYNAEEDKHYLVGETEETICLLACFMFGHHVKTDRRIFMKLGRHCPGRKEINPLDKVYREIAVLKKLDHPNVVRLVEVLDDPVEDHLYLVFELLERGEVLHLPTDQPLPESKAWQYFRDIVLGLEYLHFQRIIHRDIKPSNLLLGDDGHVQIVDLGVCNEFDGLDACLNNTAGTPAFTAPEAISPLAQFSGKAYDVWSLGITLFAFIYGHVPFFSDSIPSLYLKIQAEDVSFPTRPVVSHSLKELINQMLHKDPYQRITLQEIKEHSWVTRNGSLPLPSESENCQLVEVTEDEIMHVVTSIPKLDTLILIKTMLKKHSFQNPFPNESPMRRLCRNGRSHSAPGSFDWLSTRSLSTEGPLASVTEHASTNLKNIKG